MIYNFLVDFLQDATAYSRAFFVPFSCKSLCFDAEVHNALNRSDRAFSLSGEWESAIPVLPKKIKESYAFDDVTAEWKTVPIPCSLESLEAMRATDCAPEQTNPSQYVFRRKFEVYDVSKTHTLYFDRVGGCFEVFVNGVRVGSSYTGRGEFNVTERVVKGENEVLVRIVNNTGFAEFEGDYSQGATGITGEVMLFVRGDSYVKDFTVTTAHDGVSATGKIDVCLEGKECETEFSVYDGENELFCLRKKADDKKAVFEFGGEYGAYNSESPKLYDAYIRVFSSDVEEECVKIRVGFNSVTVEGTELLVNSCAQKIYGVRYESLVDRDGLLMTADEFEKELDLIKSYNFNALLVTVDLPYSFYDLATRKGFFIVKKIPSYSAFDASVKKNKKKTIYHTPKGIEYLCSKTVAIYNRDKNLPSVAAYDFGGENTALPAVSQALNDLRSVSARPVIAENGPVNKIVSPAMATLADAITSATSPVVIDNFVIDVTENINKTNEYLSVALAEKVVTGVFVGEFKPTFNKRYEHTLFDADLLPSERATMCKYVFRPFTSQLVDNRNLLVTNIRAFFSANDLVLTVYLVKADTSRKILSVKPHLAPGETADYEFYLGVIETGMKLLVVYGREDGTQYASEYHEVYDEEICPERLDKLRCRRYEYKVNNTIFSLDKVKENILKPRAYFVPCSTESIAMSGSYAAQRKVSDRVYSLSGEWDFAYYGNNAPVAFVNEEMPWKTITLPSTWESLGYEKFEFVSGYPFKADLATYKIYDTENEKNSVGIYRKIINVGDKSYNYILSFMRVCGSIELHVNGVYVGYSMLGRAEFDVSQYLAIGENEIVVIVKKWTPATYLEGGDGFSATGIIGDVTLTKTLPCSLYDYSVKIRKEGVDYFLDLDLAFMSDEAVVKVEMFDGDKKVFDKRAEVESGLNRTGIVGRFEGYSAEKPVLYDVLVKVYKNNFLAECTRIKVGFNNLAIIGDVAYYNDSPLKLRGVTYNPVYNELGELLTEQDIKRDFALIKEYGFDTIQPLHEVSAEFMRYAEEFGLFVIPRLGVNTKGLEKINEKKRNAVVAEPSFEELIKNVVMYSFGRDRNLPNVLFYQFVEDGNAPAIKKCVELLKANTTKPVFAYGDNGDVISACYPSINGVIDLINEAMNKKPVFFTKYALSEGIGCATMHEYEDLIANAPCCLGGCVAHFVDDYINGVGKKAVGLFSADRRPYPSAYSVKYLYRPIRSRLVKDNGAIEITNLRKHVATENLKIVLDVKKNGLSVSKTGFYVNVPPMTSKTYDITLPHKEGDMYLNVEYYENDKFLYSEQHAINSELQTVVATGGTNPLGVSEFLDNVIIDFDCGFVTFSKKLGCMVRYVIRGKDVLKSLSVADGAGSFVSNVYRPFIRNMKSPYPRVTATLRKFTCEYVDEETAKQVCVCVESLININGKDTFIIQDKYVVNASGAIEVFSVLTPLKKILQNMDCFGKQLRLHNEFGNVEYYGNGDGDNYIDMCEHTQVGFYSANVDKTFELFNALQEAGNRTNVHFLVARDNDGDGIVISAVKVPFQTRVSPYSDKEIYDSYHNGKKPKQSGVYIDVNAFVSGIGTNNDGNPLPQYVIRSGEHMLHFTLSPIVKD